MPRPAFSKDFRLWGDWLKNANPDSAYTQKIIKLHKAFPDRNLKFLRSQKISDIDISSKPISALSDKQTVERGNSLKVLKIMRREGKSLSKSVKIANEQGFNISERSAKKHLGKSLYKAGRRWLARKTDSIEYRLRIYSKGREEVISTASSKDRSLIGKYFSDIRKVEKGRLDEKDFKKRYSRRIIIDAKGHKWSLETNIEAIANIQASDSTTLYRSIYEKG